VHVPGGTFIHSAVALLPHAYILALEGVTAVVDWVARRRTGWGNGRARTLFVGAAVVFGCLLAAGSTIVVQAGFARIRAERLQVAAALDARDPARTERLMSIDAASSAYTMGRSGVVFVNDPLPIVEEVAAAYDIRWLLVERPGEEAASSPILRGDRPAWVGAPILELRDDSGTTPDVGVYPVCTQAGDTRCGATS
jgi:hypothetical protein